MQIIPITAANLSECTEIYIKAYNRPPWNYRWQADNAAQYLKEYADNPHFKGFILYDNNQAVGAVLAHQKTWWTNRQLFIDEFFVAPDKQRLGYGQKLMDHCNQYAKANGMEVLVLMTNKYMPSYKFYNKINYTTAEQFVFMFKQVI